MHLWWFAQNKRYIRICKDRLNEELTCSAIHNNPENLEGHVADSRLTLPKYVLRIVIFALLAIPPYPALSTAPRWFLLDFIEHFIMGSRHLKWTNWFKWYFVCFNGNDGEIFGDLACAGDREISSLSRTLQKTWYSIFGIICR